MDISLSGKRILVAGATGAIGRAIVEEALASGAWVAGSYFSNEEEALRLKNQGAFLVKADLSDRGRARSLVAQVLEESPTLDAKKSQRVDAEKSKGLDAFVYAAGNTRDRTLAKMTDSEWDQVLRLHLDGLYACCQAVIPLMRKQRNGKVIAFGSLAGQIGRIGQANYAAAKAATIGFIKSIAREGGPHGITANVISPGFVDSGMTRRAPEEAWERARADSALGTISSAGVVASFCVWLLSDFCQGVTGQVFTLDSRIH